MLVRASSIAFILALVILLCQTGVQCFFIGATRGARRSLHALYDSSQSSGVPNVEKPVIIEISARSEFRKSDMVDVTAFESVYRSKEENAREKAMDTPLMKLFSGIIFNPPALMAAIYLFSVGREQVSQKIIRPIMRLFGVKTVIEEEDKSTTLVDAAFQVFECERCQMEMRPARGRAEAIFSRPRFRCARCGAKASAFFDVSDMDDPRAVTRMERLERQRRIDEGEEDEDEEEDEEEDPNEDA